MSEVHETTGVELLVVAFRALSASEQELALGRCHSLWLVQQEAGGTEMARALRSLRRVAELLGESPGIEDYKRVRAELAQDGEELEPPGRITRLFNGSWHGAREAIDLAQVTTVRRVEARFRNRRLGKVWRYTDETLHKTLAEAVQDIGHLPQVAEFDWWRQRKLELATAQGEELHLPSAGPYRSRWGSWEAALLHFGYTADQVAERLERQ